MRFSHYLVAAVLLAGTAQGSEWRTPADLPAGGLPVIVPGFTFHSPGAGWQMMNDLPPKDGVIAGTMRTQFFYPGPYAESEPVPSRTAVQISVGYDIPVTQPIRTPKDLDDLVRADSDGRAAWYRERDPNAKVEFAASTLDGIHCAESRVYAQYTEKLDPIAEDAAPLTDGVSSLSVGRTCMHIDEPSFRLTLRYEANWGRGTEPPSVVQEGLKTLESVRALAVPFHAQTVPLPGRAMKMMTAGGSIWVTYIADRRDAKTASQRDGVVSIDRATNAITARVELAFPYALAPAPDGVWVETGKTLVHIDANTNTVSGSIKLAKRPIVLVAGGGFLWALCYSGPADRDSATVLRIDPASGASTEIKQPGGAPRDLIFADGSLYVEVDGALMRIDPTSLKLTGAVAIEQGVLRYDGRYLWNLVVTDSFVPARFNPDEYRPIPKPFTVRLDRLDPGTSAAPVVIVSNYTAPAMFPPSDHVWWNGRLCMLINNAVICIDPSATAGPAQVIPCNGVWFGKMLVVNGSLWVSRDMEHTVMRLDPK